MHIQIAGEEVVVEDKLYEKVKFMAERVIKKEPKQDACLENSGYEGEGKTNSSLVEAAIVHNITGRKINLFFTSASARAFAQKTDNQLIILDEPSLDALASDSNTTNVRDLLRLTSTMRKKRHFLIINFAKFWKFPEFLVVDRALGMVHLYSRHGTDPGRFLYIRKRSLETLWNTYKKNGKREYAKLKSFGGRMPYIMDKLFEKMDIRVENVEHATFKDYEEQKDKAIALIGEKKSKKELKVEEEMRELKFKIATNFQSLGITQRQLSQILRVTPETLRNWGINATNGGGSLGKADLKAEKKADIVNSMADSQENDALPSPDEDEVPINIEEDDSEGL